MEATKFTPGPWSVVMHGEAAYVSMDVGKDGLPPSATGRAEFSVQPYIRKDEAKANAALIAAAPDLYATLKALADDYATINPKYHNTDVYAAARAALLRAVPNGSPQAQAAQETQPQE